MSALIPIIIVCGLFAVLIIGWLMIAYRPEKWVPPRTPPDAPASAKRVHSLAPQARRASRDVISDNNQYRRAA